MRSDFLTIALLLGTSSALKTGKIQKFKNQALAETRQTQLTQGHNSCQSVIENFNDFTANQDCSDTTNPREDAWFPSGPQSIRWHSQSSGDLVNDENIAWNNIAARYFEIGDTIIKPESMADDVKQGALGDCYMHAACGGIAVHESAIADMALTKERNAADWYSHEVYVRGVKSTMCINADVPSKSSGVEKYGKMYNNNIWIPLLEKTWAKINGNYENIVGGNAMELFQLLVPGKNTRYQMTDSEINNNPDNLDTVLTENSDKDYIITLGMNDQDGSYATLNLVNWHAYYYLEYKTVNGKILHAVKNPWRNDNSYCGEYCDQSSVWNNIDTSDWKYTPDEEDGIYYMTAEEIVHSFSSVYVSHHVHGHVYSVYNELFEDGDYTGTKYYAFHWRGGEIQIGVEHYNYRMYPVGCVNAYSSAGATVVKHWLMSENNQDLDGRVYMWDNMYFTAYRHIENLEAGWYAVKVQTSSWNAESPYENTVMISGAVSTTLEKVDASWFGQEHATPSYDDDDSNNNDGGNTNDDGSNNNDGGSNTDDGSNNNDGGSNNDDGSNNNNDDGSNNNDGGDNNNNDGGDNNNNDGGDNNNDGGDNTNNDDTPCGCGGINSDCATLDNYYVDEVVSSTYGSVAMIE